MKAFTALVLVLCLSVTFELASADRFIIPEPIPDVPRIPDLAVKYHHVNVSIIGQHAGTEVDQVFLNDFYRDIEGTYLFPLPKGASISGFSMYVEGEELRGELLGRDEARETYEGIVRRLQDPALLEYVGRDTFKARVYPIPASKNGVPGEKRISISYDGMLSCDSGVCRYEYPLDTERFSSKPIESVLISVSIRSEKPIKSVYSPSHDVSVRRISDFQVEATFEAEDVLPEEDFVLYYTLSDEDFAVNLLAYRELGEDGFFALLLAPKYEQDEVLAKDIVFVLDSSGSMAGEKILQAKDALRFCVENLNPEDSFNIVVFASSVDSFSYEMVSASSENRGKALDYIDGIGASGGTNIDDALMTSLRMLDGDSDPNMVVFLTDGRPTVGVTEVEKILSNAKGANDREARLFVFGVGYDVNTHLLDRLSDENSGLSEYVEPGEDIEVAVSSLYTKIQNPVLSDLSVEFTGVSVKELYPKEIPDLFKGSQLVLFGRYSSGSNAEAVLRGRVGEEEKEFRFELVFPEESEENDFIPRLWATRKIGFLLDEIRLHGEDSELVDEIVNLSLTYGVMTPYTSFLVDLDVESPAAVEEGRDMLRKALDYASFWSSTGANAVQSAEETKSLKSSSVSGRGGDQVKSVGAKTFYLRDGVWVESGYSSEGGKVITYGSEEYFQLTSSNPEAGRYLSLGKEVSFCLDAGCVSVTEEGSLPPQGGNGTTSSTLAGDQPDDALSQSLLIVGFVVIICAGFLLWNRTAS